METAFGSSNSGDNLLKETENKKNDVFFIEDLREEMDFLKLKSVPATGDLYSNTYMHRSVYWADRKKTRTVHYAVKPIVTYYLTTKKTLLGILNELNETIFEDVMKEPFSVCYCCGGGVTTLDFKPLENFNRCWSYLTCGKDACRDKGKEEFGLTSKEFDAKLIKYGTENLKNANRKYVRMARCNVKSCTKMTHDRCKGCKFVFYCSRVCQKKDWRRHKEECSQKKIEKKNNKQVIKDKMASKKEVSHDKKKLCELHSTTEQK